MEDLNTKTVRFDKATSEKLEGLALKLGLSKRALVIQMVEYFYRTKKEPADINIGQLVRTTETDFFMAECFDRASDTCPITNDCKLKHTLNDATRAFLAVLDQQTLADMLPPDPTTSTSKPVRILRNAARS